MIICKNKIAIIFFSYDNGRNHQTLFKHNLHPYKYIMYLYLEEGCNKGKDNGIKWLGSIDTDIQNMVKR